MIIRRTPDRLHFITQPDHAALAAEIMTHWQAGGLYDHPRREAILAATRDHDEGWREEDEALHVSDRGDPLDFIAVPATVKHRIWPRAAGRLAAASPYVAALVAQHGLTVHAPLRGAPDWQGFFTTLEWTRDELLSRCPEGEAAALHEDYRFVRTGDHLSLIFCNGWTAPLSGPGYTAILNGITLEITPDPFNGREVRLHVRARSVPARPYASAADLRRTLADASVLQLEGRAVGG